MQGTITTIQRLSIHDGPGIRSTIFLKGCNMRCEWCHNPETWSKKVELQQIEARCIGCKSCVELCQGIVWSNNRVVIDRSMLKSLTDCTQACPSGALKLMGREVTAAELALEVCKDKCYFESSGGGVTISGGEPSIQPRFLKELVYELKKADINVAIQSNLLCSKELIEQLAPHIDLWMVDLKSLNNQKHIEFTKVNCTEIIKNIEFLNSLGANIVVRTPVIPSFNDTQADITSICKMLKEIGITKYELLEFHAMGFDKFTQMGIENPMGESHKLASQTMDKLREIVREYGF